MRKKFRAKKRIKYNYLILSILMFVIIGLYNYIKTNVSVTIQNKNIITTILNSGNEYSYDSIKKTYISDELYNYIKNNFFNSPTKLLESQLKYSYENSKEENIISFLYVKNDQPLIYIYNSHQGETYSSKYLEDYNIVPNVLMASNMLKDKLEDIGIKTIVENSSILEYMKENNLKHADSYIASQHFLSEIIKKYPSIKLYIDLHRDAAPYETTITTINGKECAKVLFVIGLENPTYNNNLLVATKLNNIIENKYPSLTRGILKKQGYGVNGVYNQNLSNNVILIEIGGNENNIEEVNNTLDLIANVIGEYLNEKK